jgi:hypothetical protein
MQYEGRGLSEACTNITDGCYFPTSEKPQITTENGNSTWNASYSNTYTDAITNPESWVHYYEGLIQNGEHSYPNNTCSQTDTQTISIQACSGATMTLYNSHTSGIRIQAGKVTAIRGNGTVSGN